MSMHYCKAVKLFFKLSLLLGYIVISGCIDLAAFRHKSSLPSNISYGKGAIYAMRGGLGGVFSLGMNRIEDTFERDYHIHATSTIWYKFYSLSDLIIKKYRSKEITGPIILVGHSLGGNDQIKVAKKLYEANVPVALLITVDAVSPLPIPPNVKEVLNIYQPSYIPITTGKKVTVVDPKRTHLINVNMAKQKNLHVNHWTITMNKEVQRMIDNKILEVINAANKKKYAAKS